MDADADGEEEEVLVEEEEQQQRRRRRRQQGADARRALAAGGSKGTHADSGREGERERARVLVERGNGAIVEGNLEAAAGTALPLMLFLLPCCFTYMLTYLLLYLCFTYLISQRATWKPPQALPL